MAPPVWGGRGIDPRVGPGGSASARSLSRSLDVVMAAAPRGGSVPAPESVAL